MYFFRAGFLQHTNNSIGSCTTNDRIINHDNALAANNFTNRIQFYTDSGLSAGLLGLNESTSYIRILNECCTVWNTRLEGESLCCSISRFGNADNEICINR